MCCHVAAVFTTNVVKAAPVLYNQSVYHTGNDIRCILTNSGNANACTGEVGMENARTMTLLASQSLGISPNEVMVNSTGVIGVQLPMEKDRKWNQINSGAARQRSTVRR